MIENYYNGEKNVLNFKKIRIIVTIFLIYEKVFARIFLYFMYETLRETNKH